MFVVRSVLAISCLALPSCGQSTPAKKSAESDAADSPSDTSEPSKADISESFAWPSVIAVMGDGYPGAGDPCRRLGESALTVNYLDDSAILVGCPGDRSDPAAVAVLAATGGEVMAVAEGVTMISVPQGDANAGMSERPGGAQ